MAGGRISVSTLLEILVEAETEKVIAASKLMFQPFLRFWCRNGICVLDVVVILLGFNPS